MRQAFQSLAYRTFLNTYNNDLPQIEAIARKEDFLIVDLGKTDIDLTDEDLQDLIERLDYFTTCPIILLRSAVNNDIKNVDLNHDKKIKEIDNCLLNLYKSFHCQAFGDYVGIKKDDITDGGSISPGFIYYDAVNNNYYGYKGVVNQLASFETIIVPDVLSSKPTHFMESSGKDFLSSTNTGWQILQDIDSRIESGKSMAKFKRISMEHYLHCIKTKIKLAEFD